MKSHFAYTDLSTDPESRDFKREASSGHTRFLETKVSISLLIQAIPLSTRSWSRSVITTGTFKLRIIKSANWEAINPAPTTPARVTLRPSAGFGAPSIFFFPF